MWVSRVLGNYHYQRMSLVTVGVARERTSNAQWPWEPSIGHNVQPFTDNGTVSIWVNNSPFGRKTTPKKQINCLDCVYLVYTLYTEFTRTVLLQNTLKPLKRMVLHLNKIFRCLPHSFNRIRSTGYKGSWGCRIHFESILSPRIRNIHILYISKSSFEHQTLGILWNYYCMWEIDVHIFCGIPLPRNWHSTTKLRTVSN